MRRPALVAHLLKGHLGHRWVRVVNDDWQFIRCMRCGREKEPDDQFLAALGDKPPPLYPSAR